MDITNLLCGLNADNIDVLPNIRKGIHSSFQRGRHLLRDGFHTLNNIYSKEGHSRKHLPEGSGKYTVGCVDIMSDHSVKGVFFRLYYPTNHTNIYSKDCKWPLWLPKKQYGQGYAYFRRMNTRVMGKLFKLVGGEVYVPVVWQAPVIELEKQFPVIIFTHGLGGNRTTYSTLCTDLASHGFIVVAIEHRDGSASFTYCFEEYLQENEASLDKSLNCYRKGRCRGRNRQSKYDEQSVQENITQVKEQWLWYERQEREDDYHVRNKQLYVRVEEIRQILDILQSLNDGDGAKNVLSSSIDLSMFRGKLDLEQMSIVGHSFGGATTLAALAHVAQFKCGIALDAWMKPLDDSVTSNITKPLLFINTETFQWKANVLDMINLKLTSSEGNEREKAMITIRGTCHQSHSDFQFLLPGKLGRYLEMRNSLKPKLVMSLNNKCLLGFLAKHLETEHVELHADLLNGEHEHIILGTNLDLNIEE